LWTSFLNMAEFKLKEKRYAIWSIYALRSTNLSDQQNTRIRVESMAASTSVYVVFFILS